MKGRGARGAGAHRDSAGLVSGLGGSATCELRWDFLEEERMMQYSRDKYFPQLRTKVINPVGEPHRTSLAAPTHTKANTCTQRKQEGCQSPWRLLAMIKSDSDR